MSSDDVDKITKYMEKVVKEETCKLVGKVNTEDLRKKVFDTVSRLLGDYCKSLIKVEVTANGDVLNVLPKNNFTADLMRGVSQDD